jgi:excisionase family DNA binding protein
MNEILLSVREAAALLSVTRLRLLRWARSGYVPSVVLPDCEFRFLRSDLEKWASELPKWSKGGEA